MAINITDTLISSNTTRHTAAVIPGVEVKGGPTAWAVTWLPGRTLTRNQAITAMTLAEHVAGTGADAIALPPEDSARWWGHVNGWAAELHVGSSFALAAIEDTLPAAAAAAPRRNHEGDPCPSWCVADHEQLLFVNAPEHGHMSVHFSATLLGASGAGPDNPRILLTQTPGRPPVITVIPGGFVAEAGIELSAADSRVLATFLTDNSGQAVIDALREASYMLSDVMLRASR